jgi:hypothetical protein
MQDRFYGDNRDLVKWGTLFELARRYGANQILQVLYYRPNSWPRITVGGEEVGIAEEVTQHFRNSKSIRCLKRSDPLVFVEVLGDTFSSRHQYLSYIISAITKRSSKPGIVFLDPDTGLEPPSRNSNLGHVLYDELTEIWRNLESGDVLVLYQHKTGMNNNDFITPKLNEFVKALGIDSAKAKYAHAPTFNTANDVAFFYAKKE